TPVAHFLRSKFGSDFLDARLRSDAVTEKYKATPGSGACRSGNLAVSKNSLFWAQTDRDHLRRLVFLLSCFDRIRLVIHSVRSCALRSMPAIAATGHRVELLRIGSSCC